MLTIADATSQVIYRVKSDSIFITNSGKTLFSVDAVGRIKIDSASNGSSDAFLLTWDPATKKVNKIAKSTVNTSMDSVVKYLQDSVVLKDTILVGGGIRSTLTLNGKDSLNIHGVLPSQVSWTGIANGTASTDSVLVIKDGVLKKTPPFLTATATLDFGNTAAGSKTDLTITVTGAADGDAVSLGVPNASTVANGSFSAWVSAVNTVTVRFTNNDLSSSFNPASGTFRIKIVR